MILLTGAAGFIGSNMLARLNEAGETDVAICDDLGAGDKWRNLRAHEFRDHLPVAALRDWLARAPALRAVIHLGAESATTATDADDVMARNFAASAALWDHCARTATPLIYASSAATYGSGTTGFADGDTPGFLATLRPLNLYGWSKHAFDRRAARDAAEGRPTPPRWHGLKFFNVYGPNEYHKTGMHSAVLTIAGAAARGEPARLFASDRADIPDGGQSRDFVHVSDLCDVMLWLLRGTAPSGLYNVGTGTARSFASLARAVFAALGQEPDITYVPMPDALRGRYQYRTEADLSKLRGAGYNAPMTGLEEGVTRYVQDFLAGEERRYR